MTGIPAARVLHVANGSSTTRLIEAAAIAGTTSLWADPLHDGPVPADLSDAALIDVRARYLAGVTGQSSADIANEFGRWRTAIDDLTSYDEVILWFEHDLFDQLNLVHLLTTLRPRVGATPVVTLVCIDAFPGRPRFKGLGELTPHELATLLDARQPVSDAQYALAEPAWQALRSPTPWPLDSLRTTDTSALPFLAPAVARLLQEYPWTSDGLSRTERRLLSLAADGPIDLLSAFPRMHDGETAYYVTDLSLVTIAETLSRTTPPLLTVERASEAGGRPLQGALTLTESGRAVLAGRHDRMATCGIDRWLGGVHLRDGSPIWRWDDRHQRIVAR